MHFSKMKEDALGGHGNGSYAELGSSWKRRAIIFCNLGDVRDLELNSGLEKCGFQVHHLDLKYTDLTLKKSTIYIFQISLTKIFS
jgi:hypothetical protein